jgi:hypothetical protein
MLLQAVRNIENNKQQTDSELLYQQVFAEEQTYLQQSEEFRKSLTTIYSDGTETPMAKARREAIESYNDEILEKLLMDIDEIEALTPTEEEAVKQAKSEALLNGVCSRCGCRVTPDVVERFEKMMDAQNDMMNAQNQRVEMLCDACYGVNFRTTDEAYVRLGGADMSSGSTSAKMWDKKRMKPRRYDTQVQQRGRLDTSSLFQMPKEYRTNIDLDAVQSQVEPVNTGDVDKAQTLRSRSRELGSRELERRKMARELELSSGNVGDQRTARDQYNQNSDPRVTRQSLDPNEEWTQVTDEKSQRMLYWNKSTGEMRKTPPE